MSVRSEQKADRRRQLLRAGAVLIAERGFPGVRLEDLGAAAGISGPAVYRHFPNKEALLVELLVGISDRLLRGGHAVVVAAGSPEAALRGLVDFHLDFALSEPELIGIHDRDLASLPPDALHRVRQTQRTYVELWVAVLCGVRPALAEDDARVAAHAVFGLLNSTPYSAVGPRARDVLRAMALAATLYSVNDD
ncbi:TetR/AcrR family transcriptional regulator [Cryptosporangium phraense]|uniref:TetR/AcrR family transcriptional regulator n=1 Tax=Cryptosporangium phraense TaxID=2593070 RepID=A0A545AL67_9ACTN|nr:TetR/AcrR family transcriptional regulator [Cryptosporangium phraense]TQS42057.1 TetR/AcrR family transcriptional regulator [Cryptosporangium phraense]